MIAATDTGRVVGFVTLDALNALKACAPDENNGYAYIWMRRSTMDAIPLVPESLLAEAESRIRDQDYLLETCVREEEKLTAQRDALQAQLDAVRGLSDRLEIAALDCYSTAENDIDFCVVANLTSAYSAIRAALGETRLIRETLSSDGLAQISSQWEEKKHSRNNAKRSTLAGKHDQAS